jgi:hypothetical protein
MVDTRYLLATIAALAALAAPAAAQASSGATYPPAAVSTYTKSCKAEARVAAKGTLSPAKIATYCRCTLRYLEAHLTYPQFKAAGRAAVTLSGGTAKAKAAFKGAIKTCIP